MRDIIKYTGLFLLIGFLQVYVFDHADISSMVRPVVFFYILLIIPYLPAWVMLMLGFCIGLLFDIFDQTMGVNAAACVLLAYARPVVLRFLKPGEINDSVKTHLRFMGMRSFIYYLLIMSFIYFIVRTFLAYFSVGEFWFIVFRIILNALVSVFFIFIIEVVVFYKRPKSQ